MPDALLPYPAYKDSGVPWLGRIPAHWRQMPGRACYREKKVSNTGLKETTVLSLSYGQIVVKPPEKLHGLVPASFETYQIVDPGDIIVRPTDLQNDWNSLRFGLNRHRGIITSAYMCFHTEDVMTREYGHLLLHAYDLKKVFYGLGSGLRQNLDWRDFKYLPCLVPPPDEQQTITRYLDYMDRRIRRIIRAKQKLIALLEEQKQAIIHQAVIGQIDVRTGRPYPAYKPSGVEWLGDVPEHWEVVRSKRLFNPRKDLALPDDVQLSATQAYGVIPQSEFEEKVGRRVVKIFMHLEKRRHVERDDFVISMRSFQGGLERAWASGAIRSSYVVLKSESGVNTDFFAYLFKSRGYIGAIQATGDFIRDGQDLNFSNFCRVDLPLVPLDEQEAIAAFIADATRGTVTTISRLQREIALLGEYRTRLLADVVTGQVDVRAAAAQLPEDAEEMDALAEEEVIEDEEDEGQVDEDEELDA